MDEFQIRHKLASLIGEKYALRILITSMSQKPKHAFLPSRAAWCVGYDRYMDHATKAQ